MDSDVFAVAVAVMVNGEDVLPIADIDYKVGDTWYDLCHAVVVNHGVSYFEIPDGPLPVARFRFRLYNPGPKYEVDFELYEFFILRCHDVTA